MKKIKKMIGAFAIIALMGFSAPKAAVQVKAEEPENNEATTEILSKLNSFANSDMTFKLAEKDFSIKKNKDKGSIKINYEEIKKNPEVELKIEILDKNTEISFSADEIEFIKNNKFIYIEGFAFSEDERIFPYNISFTEKDKKLSITFSKFKLSDVIDVIKDSKDSFTFHIGDAHKIITADFAPKWTSSFLATIDSLKGTIFVITLTAALPVLFRAILKVYNLGRMDKKGLVTKEEQHLFEESVRTDMRSWKEELTTVVLNTSDRVINEKLKDVESARDFIQEFKVDKAKLALEIEEFSKARSHLDDLTNQVRVLNTKITRLEFGSTDIPGNQRRTK